MELFQCPCSRLPIATFSSFSYHAPIKHLPARIGLFYARSQIPIPRRFAGLTASHPVLPSGIRNIRQGTSIFRRTAPGNHPQGPFDFPFSLPASVFFFFPAHFPIILCLSSQFGKSPRSTDISRLPGAHPRPLKGPRNALPFLLVYLRYPRCPEFLL